MIVAHLVTDNDAIDELVRELFNAISDPLPLFSCQSPSEVSLRRRSSVEAERRALGAGETPALIVLDGSVRMSPSEGASNDGSPAAELLKELRNAQNEVPVIVVSQASFEKLEFEVLLRWDVAIWKLPPPSSLGDLQQKQNEFSRILRGINSGEKKRHITISVGPRSAKYRVFDGHYAFTTDREYRLEYQPRQLIQLMKRFVPFEKRQIRPTWRDELSEAGRQLYALLMEDVFGPTLLDRIKKQKMGADFRFHIDLTDQSDDGDLHDLFLLPFEATNSDMRPEGFFCAQVPMARITGAPAGELGEKWGDSLKILLVVGGEGGDASIISELSGAHRGGFLAPLEQADDVIMYLKDKGSNGRSSRQVTLEILSEREARGLEFQRALQEKLSKSSYDVVHFYGHAHSSADGTFLFAPGDDEYMTRAINIRAVAKWIGDLRQKDRPPHLVFLSSCQSGSVRTAMDMMNAGVANVLGFRWEVKESAAVEFIRAFYLAFIENGQSMAEAYREACDQVRVLDMSDSLWASGILVQRSDGPGLLS